MPPESKHVLRDVRLASNHQPATRNLSMSSDHTRTTALSLLADGNSAASVARVMGIPVDVVASWQDAPCPFSVESRAACDPPHDDAQHGVPVPFVSDLARETSRHTRVMAICCAVFILALALLFRQVLSSDDAGEERPVLANLLFLAMLATAAVAAWSASRVGRMQRSPRIPVRRSSTRQK